MADIFISYSRRDMDLVHRLALTLQSRGKDVFVDIAETWRAQGTGSVGTAAPPPAIEPSHSGTAADSPPTDDPINKSQTTSDAAHLLGDGTAVTDIGGETAAGENDPSSPTDREQAELRGIPPSARWMEEIRAAIAGADAVIVIISPDFAESSICSAELGYAFELNKKIVPVVARETSPDRLPEQLRQLNWLFLGPEATFGADIDRIVEVLELDIERAHVHTRLLLRSSEWEANRRDRSSLLRGRELAEAGLWLSGQAGRRPAPTSLQGELIFASRRAAIRRQRGSLSVAVVLSLGFAGLGVIATVQRHDAVVQRQTAVRERDIAVSRQLAIESGQLITLDLTWPLSLPWTATTRPRHLRPSRRCEPPNSTRPFVPNYRRAVSSAPAFGTVGTLLTHQGSGLWSGVVAPYAFGNGRNCAVSAAWIVR